MKHINYSTNRRKALSAALLTAIGATAVATSLPANAVGIADGDYVLYINRTPVDSTTDPLNPIGIFGSDGAWNSSFTFGGQPPSSSSQKMTNNSVSISTPSGTRGSSTAGDTGMPCHPRVQCLPSGFAGGATGRIAISVSGNLVAINTTDGTPFSVDSIANTAGGTFVQYGTLQTTDAGGVNKACGQVYPTAATDQNGNQVPDGTLQMRLSGRLGGVGGNFPTPGALHDERWNVTDCVKDSNGQCTSQVDPTKVQWNVFNSHESTNGVSTITGTTILNLGDIGSGTAYGAVIGPPDGIDDYAVTIASGSPIGSDWGGFFNAVYFEVWNATILSVDTSPAVVIADCNLTQEPPGEIIVVEQTIEDGVSGCSLSTLPARAADGGAWWLMLGFLAWLKALTWRRKRIAESG